MPWPLSQDYNEAIQNPAHCFNDPELRQAEARCNAIGLPMPCSGNFADVYQVTGPGGKRWAVKCFTRQVAGLRERYTAISAYLKQVDLPFMVDFHYLDPGIKVRGLWYPALKMDWVEGLTLNGFVKQNADQPATLEALCQIWVKLARRLREAKLAHCDLQHGNVLLVPGKRDGALSVRLIDYDGMWVPALAQSKSGEVGHAAFQHPQRLRDGTYNAEVDRFPHLVIYTALRALMVGSRYLWNKYDNGDNLLFRQQDLAGPAQSPLVRELLQGNDAELRRLADQLSRAVHKPLEQTPLLDELVNPAAVSAGAPRHKRGRRSRWPAWAAGLLVLALMGLVVGGIKYGLPLLKKDRREVVAGAPSSARENPKDAEPRQPEPKPKEAEPEPKGAEPKPKEPEPKPKEPEPKPKEPDPKPKESDPRPKEPDPKPKQPKGPLVILTSAGKEQKLKTWRFVAGTRHLPWLAVKGKLADAGPEALVFREANSTTFRDGIVTYVLLDTIRSINYDSEKQAVTVRVATGEKDDGTVELTGTTKYVGINKLTIEPGAGLGGAEVKFQGGIGKEGICGVIFPAPKPAAGAAGRPAAVTAKEKSAEKGAHTATDLQAYYRAADGTIRVEPYLMFKKTIKIDLAKVKGLRLTDDKDPAELTFQVVLKDGNEFTLTLLKNIKIDDKAAVLEGLFGKSPAGYKLFPMHTVTEVEFDETVPVLASLTLLPLTDVTVKAGEDTILEIKVERKNCKGPIRVTLDGLPDKVTAAPAPIGENDNAVKVKLSIAADAAAMQRKLVRVVATADQLKAESEVRITIQKSVGVAIRPKLLPSGVLVLDNCDPVFTGKATYEDNLSFLDASGKLRARVSGLNIAEEIGSPHRLAVDSSRKRVWVAEMVGKRLLQYDLSGKKILAVPDIKASALAVDPDTGHVWVSRSTGKIGEGSTEVFDQTGRSLASHKFHGYDIAYGGKGKAFWLVEKDLVKVSPEGKELVRINITGWCAVSVAVDQKTGAVWVVTRKHPQAGGQNELLGFDNEGKLLYTIPLGARMPFRVAVDPHDGMVWVTNKDNSLLRYSAKGELEAEHQLRALTADVDRSTGNVWVVTTEEILKVDRNGKIVSRIKHRANTSQAWISSY